MQNINKTLLARNIKYLAEQKGIKIGSLEDKIGVSTGYFSRLANEESKPGSSQLDIIFAAANVLKISINTLVSSDLSSFTQNEKLLSEFFDKLQKDTEEENLVWEMESQKMLNNDDYISKHPLFNFNKFGNFYYKSKFDTDASLSSDCFKCAINGTILYLMSVFCNETNSNGFELYFVSKKKVMQDLMKPIQQKIVVEKICKAYPKSNLYNQINSLYNDAAESSRHLKISDSVLSTIQEYIKQSSQNGEGFSTEPPPIRV